MNATNSYLHSYSDLGLVINDMLARHQKLKQWQDQVFAGETTVRSQLNAFSITADAILTVSHPLIGHFERVTQTWQAGMSVPLAEMSQAWQLAGAAQLRLVQLEQEMVKLQKEIRQFTQDLEQKKTDRDKLKQWGWLLLIFVIGAFLLIKAYLSHDSYIKETDELDANIHILITKVEELKQAISGQQQIIDHNSQMLAVARQHALRVVEECSGLSGQFFKAKFEECQLAWQNTMQELPPFFWGDWSETAWRAYGFKAAYRTAFLLTGLIRDNFPSTDAPFVVPAFADFARKNQTVVLEGTEEQTLALMHTLILQLAVLIPYGAVFTLLDPASAGQAFPMRRSLPEGLVRHIGADIYRDLEIVSEDISRIIHTYLDDQTRSFDELPEHIKANERFEFIFAANFPDGYDRRTIEILQKISRNGPVAGKYLFIQKSPDKQLPRDLSWDDFYQCWHFNNPQMSDEYSVAPLICPKGAAQSMILQLLAAQKPPEAKITWQDVIDNNPEKWWSEEVSRSISAPIGMSGRDKMLTIWFGVNRDGRPCTHGILGAMTGSGKSNLYHVLICGLATRYSPEELNFYLIDGKHGVEFQVYRCLPHARVVALHSAPELSRSVLEELIAEMGRRNDIFKRLGVVDLSGYAEQGLPEKIPRIVLMIDEYQELFEDDRLGHASAMLLQLAQQGRSAGIHLLLGSQRFGAVGMLNQTAIFGNIHLRMAMKMSLSDIQSLTEFGRDGKRLISQCDQPGKLVLNDQSGDDRANEFGKVALLETSERARLLAALVAKADVEWPLERRFAIVIFDGEEQPNFIENPQAIDLLRLNSRPIGDAWQRIATAPVHERGLGASDWFDGEHPVGLWFGQEQNVHGQARIILRRRAMENILLVGENQAAIYGMLIGIVCSVPVNLAASRVRLWIMDRAVPGTPWKNAFSEMIDAVLVTLGYSLEQSNDAILLAEWLDVWCKELERRAALSEDDLAGQPTWLITMASVDRIPQLMRIQGKHHGLTDSPQGELLKRLCREGPMLGLHIIMTFPATGSLKQLFDRPQVEQFKHRIVSQISEADAFWLTGKDSAAKLQRVGAKPVFAIYADSVGGTETKLKPYTVEAQIPWHEQAQTLVGHLQKWQEG